MILAATFSQNSKSQQKEVFRGNDLFFWFLRPQNGGVPPTRVSSQNLKNGEMWPILGYFCLLWAGPVEQCCTPTYLPMEDFRQKLPFSLNSLAPKEGRGGSSHPNFLPNHQKSWNSAYFGVFLSTLGWYCRTVLHTSVPAYRHEKNHDTRFVPKNTKRNLILNYTPPK